MKSIILKHRLLVGVLSLFMALFVAVSCDDDDPIGFSPTADLQTLITEAENLIATSEEGTSPGDFQPGSKEQLQKVLTWVNWALANSTEESELNKAEVRLQRYIDIFKSSTVSLAIPIFDNSTGSWIEISENINPLLADNFTIEIESYNNEV